MTGIRQYLHHSLFLCNQVDTDICNHLSDQHRSLYLRYDKIKNTGILHTWKSFHMEEGILIILTEGFLNGALKRAILRGYCCRFMSAPVEFWRYKKKFHQGALTIAICFGDFACVALKLERVARGVAQFFQVSIHVHPCHSLQQTRGNSFNAQLLSQKTKLGRYFWNSIDAKIVLVFEKIADCVT